MLRFEPLRILLATAAAAVGAVLASALGAPVEPAILSAAFAALACWGATTPPPQTTGTIAPIEDPSPTLDPDMMLAAIDDPLLIVDRQRVTHANAAALKILGDHIVGEDVRLAIRHPAAAERLAHQTVASGGTQAIELLGLGDHERRWEMRIHPIGMLGLLVRLKDRTDAHAAEKMRVDFVANASHELRTPLATLIGFIETLEDRNAGDDPATRARFLQIMGREAKRMQRLVADLMSLSRIEAEKYSVPQTAVPLAPLLHEVCDALQPGVESDNGRIVVDIEDHLPPVAGDSAQLSQLLHNVIGNALKYGRPGSQVRVSLGRQGTMAKLSVADEGDGIAPEHLPRLTERFYRVDPGRSRAIGGTGLGLAIVKHIAERHRGRLEIESQVGHGTTVHLSLPLVPDALSSNSNANVTQGVPNSPSGLVDPA